MAACMVGISFHTASVDVLGKATLHPAEVPSRLQAIRAEFPGSELVLLSTCNRTELYVAGLDAPPRKERLVRHLLRQGGDPEAEAMGPHFYVKQDLQAAEHLFAVASGLDAMVVGETEILGQVKQALALAEEHQMTGKVIHTLFQNAFRTAKRVHSGTELGRGRLSVASLAVEFAEKIFDDLVSRTVMVVGAGETAELALKHLVDRGVRDVLVLNRTHAHGQNLARRCGGRALQFGLLDDYLARADIVISSTSAPHLVIRAEAVRRATVARGGRPILLIDIAVPRDIDPAAGQLDQVHLYSLDDLQRLAAENLVRRQEAVEQAWSVVKEGLDEYARRLNANTAQRALAI